jgi:hypothetical protein
MRQEIEEALGCLLGLPLWRVGRAGIAWFQFGGRRTIPAARGSDREVGEVALHLASGGRHFVVRATGIDPEG